MEFYQKLMLTALEQPRLLHSLKAMFEIPIFAVEYELKHLRKQGYVIVDNNKARLADEGRKHVIPAEFKAWLRIKSSKEDKKALLQIPGTGNIAKDNLDDFKGHEGYATLLKFKRQGLVEIFAKQVVLSYLGECLVNAFWRSEKLRNSHPLKEPTDKMKLDWANLQFGEFNNDECFGKTLKLLEERDYETLHFAQKESKKLDRVWNEVYLSLADAISKQAKLLFEYKLCYRFYYSHIATNIVVFYMLKNSFRGSPAGDFSIRDFIVKKLLYKGYLLTPVFKMGYQNLWEDIWPYYLALKWFYSEKTSNCKRGKEQIIRFMPIKKKRR